MNWFAWTAAIALSSSADAAAGAADSKLEGDAPVFHLRDGARIAGRPRIEALSVETRYGALRIPRGDLLQVRFARRISEADREGIERALSRLGSEDFDEREQAMAELRKLGARARRQLLLARKSGSDEVKNRAEILLGEMAAAPAPAGSRDDSLEPLPDDEDDEVITGRFTVRGRVLDERLLVESRYGPLDLELKDLTGITFHPESKISRSVDVPASSSVPESWLNTKLSVARGQRIALRARGQVSVPNYNLTSGPEGTTRYSGSTFQSFPMLSLVGRIGRNGKPFLVGKEYQGKASREGTLYLGIVPFRRNYPATGSFQVKVETGAVGSGN